MHKRNGATEKHVRFEELKDYYDRGQNVILYQHRPQMTKKQDCIEGVLTFQREFLKADSVMRVEFPKYTNRFYFIFMHKTFEKAFRNVYYHLQKDWSKNEFCCNFDWI